MGDEDEAYENSSNNPDKNRSLSMDPWSSNKKTRKESKREDVDDPDSNDFQQQPQPVKQEKQHGIGFGMNPIPNPGIKEAMEEYLAKNYSPNEDITMTEEKRQKVSSLLDGGFQPSAIAAHY